ncbi:MAG TPA: flavin reductase family protein [Pseudonocardia sp.]|nr:flavin reductase family protein [Pseudonocardia sp.]
MHVTSESPILYFGTPVVLISTMNEDGSVNLAPMSSAWWLGWRCVLGLGASSKTTENLLRAGECVLNLPSDNQVDAVDALARTTGSDPVPEFKVVRGYHHEPDKFGVAGLTPAASEVVTPPRALECPVQLEATLSGSRALAGEDPRFAGFALAIEVGIERLHLSEDILLAGNPNRVDPDRWRPLIMSFAEFYALGDGVIRPSRLAEIPQDQYPRAGAHPSVPVGSVAAVGG